MLNDKAYLKHIVEAVSDIKEFLEGIQDVRKFTENKLLCSAGVRQIEIIGEAANRLSQEFKIEHSDIPWKVIVGMRNRLIHGYFGVDYQLVYAVCLKEIPDLKKNIEKILAGGL